MSEKKDNAKFTVQFNPADPLHQQTIDMLNRQGRRKAQFIANAVTHYIYCKETPDIPQAAPISTEVIEAVVLRILEQRTGKGVSASKQPQKTAERKIRRSESIDCGDISDSIGEEGMAAIFNSMAQFKK